jgi:hypothetical protein
MSPEFEQIRSKRAFLVPLSVAVAAAISACGGGTTTETVHEAGQVRTVHEPVKKHHGPSIAEQAERERQEDKSLEREVEKIEEEAEEEEAGGLEAAPGGTEAPAESTHYSHGSHNSHYSHNSHSSHVSGYGGESGGGHYSHSSHSSHSSHYSSS